MVHLAVFCAVLSFQTLEETVINVPSKASLDSPDRRQWIQRIDSAIARDEHAEPTMLYMAHLTLGDLWLLEEDPASAATQYRLAQAVASKSSHSYFAALSKELGAVRVLGDRKAADSIMGEMLEFALQGEEQGGPDVQHVLHLGEKNARARAWRHLGDHHSSEALKLPRGSDERIGHWLEAAVYYTLAQETMLAAGLGNTLWKNHSLVAHIASCYGRAGDVELQRVYADEAIEHLRAIGEEDLSLEYLHLLISFGQMGADEEKPKVLPASSDFFPRCEELVSRYWGDPTWGKKAREVANVLAGRYWSSGQPDKAGSLYHLLAREERDPARRSSLLKALNMMRRSRGEAPLSEYDIEFGSNYPRTLSNRNDPREGLTGTVGNADSLPSYPPTDSARSPALLMIVLGGLAAALIAAYYILRRRRRLI